MNCSPVKNEEKKVNKWLSDWVLMWNSYDLLMVDELFVADSTVTYFSSEKEGLIKGIDAVRKHHEGFGFVKNGKAQKNKLWVEDLHIQVFGAVAIVKGVWFFKKPDKESVFVQKGPFTVIYIKKGEKYLITHMHFANYK